MHDEVGRYVMSSDKYHQEAIRRGLQWLLSASSEILLFYVAETANLTDQTYIRNAMGEKLATELAKNMTVAVNNRKINLITLRKKDPKPSTVRLLAIWATSNELTEIERHYRIANMLVIPWNVKDIEEWQDKYHPIQLCNELL